MLGDAELLIILSEFTALSVVAVVAVVAAVVVVVVVVVGGTSLAVVDGSISL